ncbi:metal ABC transporter substrate-binding protein [Haloarchaeobius litoreus]|uniref:Metal ABC transporter substrate-binding protein n=1 Tax=Haloarchaeobius litoreus TaxID=755306 RepID=A0ABD6DG28_9EURY|nr:metal ABC transporter substrate-binding protein [Haloarchaeobius litoreus]
MRELTRRRVLAAGTGLAGLSAVAGCLGGLNTGDETETSGVQSSFFVFGAVAAAVAGDATDASVLVPVGQHGHGWEPGPRVRESIRDASLLVHGMSGFQPWVDDITTDLAADDAAVETVDASADVDLLPLGGDHDDGDHETEHGSEHHDEHTATDHHEGDHSTEHTGTEHHHEEDDATEHHDDEGHHDGHDHGGESDPHFWLDPLRVRTAVETVRERLVATDPANADVYDANATAYRERLDSLHADLESTVADASKGTLLVAGHDAFQYLGDRYGVEVEALTGMSPDSQPTARDIERAQEVIEHHDLQYICADPLESQRAAEQLVAETDATEVLPLTALPGLHDDWADRDWGYVDVVENVNRPTLERALEA